MAPEGIHIPDIDREIVARLPLDVEGRVHRIGKLIIPRVRRKIKRSIAVLYAGGIWHGSNAGIWIDRGNGVRISRGRSLKGCSPGIRESRATGLKRAGERGRAELSAHKGLLLVDHKWTARREALCARQREVRIQLTAVVIHSPSCADNHFAAEHFRAPGNA